jgi:translocation and assembly module TamB
VSGKRFAWIAAVSLAGLLAIAVVAGVLVLRSHWFYEQVRLRVVSTVETATGGRVEAGSFQFDWTRLRAEIRGFVLHGLEPRDSPPLFRASSVAVGLRIVSLVKRDVDIQYLEVVEPQIHLIVDPDGRTNVPEPKIKSRDERTTVETILSLAIGRFDIQNGLFEVQWDRRPAPSSQTFAAHGRNLRAHFLYELAGPRYRGTVSIEPLEVQWPGRAAVPLAVNLAVTLEKNRIGMTSAKFSTGESRIELSGSIDDLVSPHGT